MAFEITKRLFDIIIVIPAIIILSPLIIVISLLVYFKMGSPIVFRQVRPGLNERPFIIYKFRTMTNGYNENGKLLSDAIRLTRFGRFLRSWSLDELPELFNVLKGDMSLVGPRPLLSEYLPLYKKEQNRRHEVKPGITGWAQVNGRNAISWDEKFKLDVWYVDHRSFWLDNKILLLTLIKVLKREGIDNSTKVTMEPFKGSEPF